MTYLSHIFRGLDQSHRRIGPIASRVTRSKLTIGDLSSFLVALFKRSPINRSHICAERGTRLCFAAFKTPCFARSPRNQRSYSYYVLRFFFESRLLDGSLSVANSRSNYRFNASRHSPIYALLIILFTFQSAHVEHAAGSIFFIGRA